METINIYYFDELSEESQNRAIKKWRNSAHDDFDFQAEAIIEDFSTICDILGISLKEKNPVSYSVGYCQSDYASFYGTYRYNKGALAKIKEYAPKDSTLEYIAKELQNIQKKYFYKLTVEISSGGYRESHMCVDVNDTEGQYRYTCKYDELESEFKHIFSNLAHWLYKRLCEALDYVYSEDYIKETIIANEYKFLEDGRMI